MTYLTRAKRALLTVALCATTLPAFAQDLRLGLVTPPPHQWTRSAEHLAERIAAETEGRITLSVFPAGQLGNEAQMLQQLQSGALDFGFFTVGELVNRNPDFGALTAPYLVGSAEEAGQLLAGPTATAMLDQMAPLGLKGLGWGMAGMRIVLVSKPLGAAGTVAGLKIRTVPLAQELDFWSKAGAAPTPLPLPELFDAYTNGQIDGMQLDFEGTYNMRYHDHSALVGDTGHMILPMAALASGRKWASLAPADQELIARLVAEEVALIRSAYPQIDADYRAKLVEAGAPVETLGPEVFGTAVEDWYGEWRARTPVLEALEAEAKALRP